MNQRRTLLVLAAIMAAGFVLPTMVPAAPIDAPQSLGPRDPLGSLSSVSPGSDAPLTPSDAPVLEGGVKPGVVRGQPGTETGASTAAPGVVPPSTPYTRLLGTLAAQPDLDAIAFGERVAQYFAELGYAVPSPAAPGDPVFEENSTISYTYGVGDLDGDGTEDVVLDTFCVDLVKCKGINSITSPDWANRYANSICGWPHVMKAVSGVSGEPIWNRSMHSPLPLGWAFPLACSYDFVIGQLPIAGGARTGFLVYEYQNVRPALLATTVLVENTIKLVDSQDGSTVWSYTVDGYWQNTFLQAPPRVDVAENLVLNPLAFAEPSVGLSLVPDGFQPTVLVRGIGFNATILDSATTDQVGYLDQTLPILIQYKPNEWAARLNVDTGAREWRKQTFQPDVARSLIPGSLESMTFPLSGSLDAAVTSGLHWLFSPCCFDNTGDGVADLPFTTYEWYPVPEMNSDGPLWVFSRLVVFDGASGDELYSHVLEEAAPEPIGHMWHLTYNIMFHATTQFLGDVNGDGAGDYAVHGIYDILDGYNHVLSVRNGPDGAELWRVESPRDMAITALGDADGDGGDDFLLFDWNPVTFWFANSWGYDNVTATPMAVYSGRDGSIVWRTQSVTAARDLVYQLETVRINGLWDFNGDGVGDVLVDDPLMLPDLTMVHRVSFLSGTDGSRLWGYSTVGAFSFPMRVGDATGDGRDDYTILSGDANDLWLTLGDGETGQEIWSRRVLAPRTSSYALAVPKIRFHSLDVADRPQDDLFMNFHFTVLTYGGFISLSVTNPQIISYDGASGQSHWAVPRFYDPNISLVVAGPTPASNLYYQALGEPPATAAQTAADVGLRWGPGVAVFGGTFALSYALSRRRFTP